MTHKRSQWELSCSKHCQKFSQYNKYWYRKKLSCYTKHTKTPSSWIWYMRSCIECKVQASVQQWQLLPMPILRAVCLGSLYSVEDLLYDLLDPWLLQQPLFGFVYQFNSITKLPLMKYCHAREDGCCRWNISPRVDWISILTEKWEWETSEVFFS